MKVTQEDGSEIEVYTAAEVKTQLDAKEAEFKPKLTEAQEALQKANEALGARANEFKQFRELSKETLAKLSEAERVNYENGLALKKAQDEREVSEKKMREANIDSVLRNKAGKDEKLFTKMKDMWAVIGIDAQTAEQMEHKSNMILGAIGATEPDLLAGVAGFSGSYKPPVEEGDDKKSFGDSERGAAGAAELGLKLKPDEKK